MQTATPGVLFADAWANRMTVTCQGQDFFILSKADLIRSQCAAGKPADREDLMLLRDDADPPAPNRAALGNHAHDRQQQKRVKRKSGRDSHLCPDRATATATAHCSLSTFPSRLKEWPGNVSRWKCVGRTTGTRYIVRTGLRDAPPIRLTCGADLLKPTQRKTLRVEGVSGLKP